MALVDPDTVRVPCAIAWASLRKSAQGAGEAEVVELDRGLVHWPDRLRRIIGTQEMADDWWHEGEEPDPQPWLGLVRTLEVGVTEILAVPKSSSWDRYGFPSIRRIELSSADSRRASIALGRLPRLAEMDLGQVTAEGRQPIKLVAAAAPMRVLQLRRCGIDKRGLAVIRDHHHEKLEELDLQFNEIGSGGVEILAQWPVDAPLRKLRVSSCFLRSSDFREWLDARLLQTLTNLDIRNNYLDDRSIDRLVTQPPGRLREVLVEGNPLSPASLARLREWLESRVSRPTTS